MPTERAKRCSSSRLVSLTRCDHRPPGAVSGSTYALGKGRTTPARPPRRGSADMSAQFQVDTDRIAAAAGDVARISAEIEGQVGVMLARLTGLQDAWTGTASAQFQGVVAQWRGTQQQVRASLDSIGQVLGAAGSQYAEAEANATRMFS